MAPRGVIQLLDSAQGHPLQTWRIDDRSHVTIGRAEDNDVVVADPYVSRAHAYLQYDYPTEKWRLISISSQQVVIHDKQQQELSLDDGMIFRLGPNGCYLRFNQTSDQIDGRKTMAFDATLMPIFSLDKQKMHREVSEIVDGNYFQTLKDAAYALRQQRASGQTSKP